MGVAHVEAGDARRVAGRGGRPGGPACSRCAGARRATVPGSAAQRLGSPVPGAARRRPLGHPVSTRPVVVCILVPIYRIDISGTRPIAPESDHDHARARHPRTAEGAAAPRLRAEEAPRRDARLAVGHLVRLALSRRCAGSSATAPSRCVDPDATVAAPMPATGSLDGDLAAARLRRARQADPPHPQGVPHHRRAATPASRSCSSTTTPRRRRAHLRAEARVLPVTSTRRRALELLERRRAALADRLAQARRRSTPGAATATPARSFEHRTQSTATRPRVGRRAHRRRRPRRRSTRPTPSTAPRPEGATAS